MNTTPPAIQDLARRLIAREATAPGERANASAPAINLPISSSRPSTAAIQTSEDAADSVTFRMAPERWRTTDYGKLG